MLTIKMERINSEVAKAIGETIQFDIKDPRIVGTFITVVKCEITKDLKFCKTYVSIFPFEKSDIVITILKNSESFIKRNLAKKVMLRNIPSIAFVLDKGAEYSNKIDNLLKEIKK